MTWIVPFFVLTTSIPTVYLWPPTPSTLSRATSRCGTQATKNRNLNTLKNSPQQTLTEWGTLLSSNVKKMKIALTSMATNAEKSLARWDPLNGPPQHFEKQQSIS